jgi:carbon-monoxide dehydrogenase large subunit
MASVRVVHGDSRTSPFAMMGTGGSRAATVASGAVLGAAREIRSQVAAVAAHLFEASPDDIEVVDGVAQVRGTPSIAMPLAQVAMTAWMAPQMLPPGMSAGIEATFDFAAGDGGWTQSVHSCFVEVDVETGFVDILRYVVVEDCGDVINPAIVEGQIRGGIAQGIAGVLYEHAAYDEHANFRTATFMDYLLPTATEIPPIEIHHVDQTVTTQEVNSRGVGEGGAIGAPAAVTNAIEDALAPFGVKVTDQYLPPARILELVGAIPTPA